MRRRSTSWAPAHRLVEERDGQAGREVDLPLVEHPNASARLVRSDRSSRRLRLEPPTPGAQRPTLPDVVSAPSHRTLRFPSGDRRRASAGHLLPAISNRERVPPGVPTTFPSWSTSQQPDERRSPPRPSPGRCATLEAPAGASGSTSPTLPPNSQTGRRGVPTGRHPLARSRGPRISGRLGDSIRVARNRRA